MVIVHLVAGARPNFMKVAPLYHALHTEDWCRPVLVHTEQHYDLEMSDWLWRDLSLPQPDVRLGVGSGTHATQTAAIMVGYEKVCLGEERPDLVVVVGDVNSTMACALVAAKLRIPVAHLEAGLRSFNRDMPEEINRVVTDAVADLLWTPSEDADANLLREGVPADRIDMVGNIMIDSYEFLRERIRAAQSHERLDLGAGAYGVVTLHRPANVDDPVVLARLVEALATVSAQLPLVFPVHPRAQASIQRFGLSNRLAEGSRVRVIDPLGYIDFMSLVEGAQVVITDSGGVQEETTYLGIPCLTVRPETERPVTVRLGTNRLVEPEGLVSAVEEVLRSPERLGSRPALWDGRTAQRVVRSIERLLKDPSHGEHAEEVS